MEQASNSKVKNILIGLSSDKRIQKLLGQFQALSTEIKKKNSELTQKIDLKTQERVAEAIHGLQGTLKSIQTLEDKIESEIEKTLTKVKNSTKDLEKSLKTYKTKALQQVKHFQNLKNSKMTKVSKKKKTAAKAKKSRVTSAKSKFAKTSKKDSQIRSKK